MQMMCASSQTFCGLQEKKPSLGKCPETAHFALFSGGCSFFLFPVSFLCLHADRQTNSHLRFVLKFAKQLLARSRQHMIPPPPLQTCSWPSRDVCVYGWQPNIWERQVRVIFLKSNRWDINVWCWWWWWWSMTLPAQKIQLVVHHYLPYRCLSWW